MILFCLIATAVADVGTVQLSGTITGSAGNPVMIELLRPQDTGQHPLLIWTGVLADGDGEFSVSIPAQLGDALLRAAVDIELNGLGANDPQIAAPIPLVIGTQSVGEITLQIEPAPQPILDP